MAIEPTINGNKLTWTDGKYNWTLTGTAINPEEPPTTPPPTQPPTTPGEGIWLSQAEIKRLPMTGAAWAATLNAASGAAGEPDLSNQDSSVNVTVLAKALVFARTGETRYREDVLAAVRSIISTTQLGRTLALGRELAAYVVAADLVGVPDDMRAQFSNKLRELRSKAVGSGHTATLITTHEKRPNNWGTHCGASRAAVAAYLGDKADLARTAQVFEGWLGNRASYAGFQFGDPGWQADKANPVGINRPGATISGHNVDGALPEEMRRGGAFKWPPPAQNYVGGGMSGAVAQAWFLHRAGYEAFEWADRALLRAAKFWHDNGHTFDGDDAWLVSVINKVYGTNFPVNGTGPGKNMGWTQWTHA